MMSLSKDPLGSFRVCQFDSGIMGCAIPETTRNFLLSLGFIDKQFNGMELHIVNKNLTKSCYEVCVLRVHYFQNAGSNKAIYDLSIFAVITGDRELNIKQEYSCRNFTVLKHMMFSFFAMNREFNIASGKSLADIFDLPEEEDVE
jgi:hypothetical protein